MFGPASQREWIEDVDTLNVYQRKHHFAKFSNADDDNQYSPVLRGLVQLPNMKPDTVFCILVRISSA